MAAKPSIKVTKSFPYRGATQEFSNRYHFDGKTGLSPADWAALVAAIQADERATLDVASHLVRYTGYEAGSDVPVFSSEVNLVGTATYDATDIPTPGDTAALVRYSTTQRTSKNHPIYLFNYYHDAKFESAAGADTISLQFKSSLENLATLWVGGFTVGGATIKRCGPNGAVAQGSFVETFLTHRDFPR